MFEKVKELCDSFLTKGVPGFDLLVYQHGKEILRYMGGYSDLENNLTIYFAKHLLSSPVQGQRSQVYDLVIAALLGEDSKIKKADENYNYTY